MKKKKKISNIIKQNFRKLKYLDKTQANYFIVMSFLLAFCLFTGGTYSYFTFSKHLNAATITIAKLNYNLSSSTSGYSNGSINVPANGTLILDLSLESLNSSETKYALKYSTTNTNVKVYYSENLANNMSGVIGSSGSKIAIRVILENNSSTAADVNFTIAGGYLQNDLTSNITEGYYEADVIIRSVLLDENLQNAIIEKDFPSSTSEYAYFRTQCSNDTTATWDNENWSLNLSGFQSKDSCDVYFKKISSDIEIYFGLKHKDGTVTFETNAPSTSTYTFEKAECNNGATASWNATNQKLDISGIKDKTICTGYFTEN